MQLNWFDRTGKIVGTIGERADYGDVEISPDGTRATVSELDPGTGRDMWIFDLARGLPTRLTTDPADEYAVGLVAGRHRDHLHLETPGPLRSLSEGRQRSRRRLEWCSRTTGTNGR